MIAPARAPGRVPRSRRPPSSTKTSRGAPSAPVASPRLHRDVRARAARAPGRCARLVGARRAEQVPRLRPVVARGRPRRAPGPQGRQGKARGGRPLPAPRPHVRRSHGTRDRARGRGVGRTERRRRASRDFRTSRHSSNRGGLAGASLAHSHSQLVWLEQGASARRAGARRPGGRGRASSAGSWPRRSNSGCGSWTNATACSSFAPLRAASPTRCSSSHASARTIRSPARSWPLPFAS